MSATLGALVLEIAARQILPVLVSEVGTQAVRHATRRAARADTQRATAAPRLDAPPVRMVSTVTVGSQTPGRVRLQVPGLRGQLVAAQAATARLQRLAGVSKVEANALTGNVLVQYDPAATTLARIVKAAEPPAPRGARARRPAVERRLALVGN
jgi:hypothetical protein